MNLTIKEKRELFEELKKELMKAQKVYVEICRDEVQLPEYANIHDAGMDIRSAIDIIIEPGETAIVPTGLKVAIPEGYELQARPRSGLSLKTPLRISNSPGTIDCGYRNEIGIIVTNTSPLLYTSALSSSTPKYNVYSIAEKGNKAGIYQINKGDRIAQIVLNKFETIEFEQVESEIIKTLGINRGGGFGSSGIK